MLTWQIPIRIRIPATGERGYLLVRGETRIGPLFARWNGQFRSPFWPRGPQGHLAGCALRWFWRRELRRQIERQLHPWLFDGGAV